VKSTQEFKDLVSNETILQFREENTASNLERLPITSPRIITDNCRTVSPSLLKEKKKPLDSVRPESALAVAAKIHGWLKTKDNIDRGNEVMLRSAAGT